MPSSFVSMMSPRSDRPGADRAPSWSDVWRHISPISDHDGVADEIASRRLRSAFGDRLRQFVDQPHRLATAARSRRTATAGGPAPRSWRSRGAAWSDLGRPKERDRCSASPSRPASRSSIARCAHDGRMGGVDPTANPSRMALPVTDPARRRGASWVLSTPRSRRRRRLPAGERGAIPSARRWPCCGPPATPTPRRRSARCRRSSTRWGCRRVHLRVDDPTRECSGASGGSAAPERRSSWIGMSKITRRPHPRSNSDERKRGGGNSAPCTVKWFSSDQLLDLIAPSTVGIGFDVATDSAASPSLCSTRPTPCWSERSACQRRRAGRPRPAPASRRRRADEQPSQGGAVVSPRVVPYTRTDHVERVLDQPGKLRRVASAPVAQQAVAVSGCAIRLCEVTPVGPPPRHGC